MGGLPGKHPVKQGGFSLPAGDPDKILINPAEISGEDLSDDPLLRLITRSLQRPVQVRGDMGNIQGFSIQRERDIRIEPGRDVQEPLILVRIDLAVLIYLHDLPELFDLLQPLDQVAAGDVAFGIIPGLRVLHKGIHQVFESGELVLSEIIRNRGIRDT